MNEDFGYSTTEVAKILGLTRFAVNRWVREGDIPAVRVGRNWRISKETLEKLKTKYSIKFPL